MNKRLNQYGLETEELGGGGNCFFNSIAPHIGMSPVDLRHGVANQMRQYESEYNKYGNFIEVGGFKSYCQNVYESLSLLPHTHQIYSDFSCFTAVLQMAADLVRSGGSISRN